MKTCTQLAIACLLVVTMVTPSFAQNTVKDNARVYKNRAPLNEAAFYPLPLTSVKPTGWLKRQLQIQADGLTGHLDEFWPDLGAESAWLGGKGEGWERGPYFADGLVPLAYLLDDARLIEKAHKWVEWTLANQRPDGSIGPVKNRDWWPNMIMLKVLTQHYEATGDERVIPLMQKYFAYHLKYVKERPLHDWASFRWGEELVSILWLYNRTGDASLLELAQILKTQGHDWKGQFKYFPFREKATSRTVNFVPNTQGLSVSAMSAHGVNNAMGLKYATMWSMLSGDASDRKAGARMLDVLDKFHGLAHGLYSSDEHYGGTDPSQGTELCTVVEAMFSIEHIMAVTGDVALGDRLEKVTFNALPATLTADMWAHQYDQQPNQVLVDVQRRQWSTNGDEANVFGIEPHFGCCTANMHQGWPKFAASLWMATPDNGLAAVAYAPNEVNTTVANGVAVRVREETEYPFRSRISMTVDPAQTVAFPIQLRIPSWADAAVVKVNGKQQSGVKAGTFYTVNRTWKAGDRIEITFPMAVRTVEGHAGSVAVERGPLVYSLKIGEDWQKLTEGMHRPAKAPAADWAVRPTTPWNYGLSFDDVASDFKVVERPIGDYPFSVDGAGVMIVTKGRLIPSWTLVQGSAGPMPQSPVVTEEPEAEITLLPYGAARLRVTSFPVVK